MASLLPLNDAPYALLKVKGISMRLYDRADAYYR